MEKEKESKRNRKGRERRGKEMRKNLCYTTTVEVTCYYSSLFLNLTDTALFDTEHFSSALTYRQTSMLY